MPIVPAGGRDGLRRPVRREESLTGPGALTPCRACIPEYQPRRKSSIGHVLSRRIRREAAGARRLLCGPRVTWQRPLAALAGQLGRARPRARRPRGRPPIHLSASLNLVLPSQLLDQYPGEGSLPGEKRLMLAVLEDAITIVVKHDRPTDARGRRLLADTAGWLASSDADSPFSFVNVCEALGLDPSYLRRGIARLARSA